MIAAITGALICATMAAQHAPDVPSSLNTCVEIAEAAHDHGVQQRLAVAVGYRESRWRYGLVSSAGAHGPMQVKPEYHCPSGELAGCDLVDAGMGALRRYLDEEAEVMPALCRYATGTGWARCAYALRVLDVAGWTA